MTPKHEKQVSDITFNKKGFYFDGCGVYFIEIYSLSSVRLSKIVGHGFFFFLLTFTTSCVLHNSKESHLFLQYSRLNLKSD